MNLPADQLMAHITALDMTISQLMTLRIALQAAVVVAANKDGPAPESSRPE